MRKSDTVGSLKRALSELTYVLPKRQKIVGLKVPGGGQPSDDLSLNNVKINSSRRIMMIGTPEEELFVDLADGMEPDVLNDLDYEYKPDEADNAVKDSDNIAKVEEYSAKLKLNMLHQPRPGKKLLVLDLDYTLFDMKSKAATFEQLKRPFTDFMLSTAYQHYDMVIWSQTSWKWLEIKLTALGLLTNPNYKIMFVMDVSSMFRITSRDRKGRMRNHAVKALKLIWDKFPDRYGPRNTIHLDDVSRNFALNAQSGLKIKAYKNAHKNRDKDRVLISMTMYLLMIKDLDFRTLDHSKWKEYVVHHQKLVEPIAAALRKQQQQPPPS
eukprot:TRINITY_DN65549_c12_g1_i1.p1 TRINITY_DN65549_c12_g1~~TRINITY_DN65549_c12_g1_i1.p1  ORF type:complete len:377 (+),score=217.10 TRINITY_DN65549_c12_g1_i1:157-1131(+)